MPEPFDLEATLETTYQPAGANTILRVSPEGGTGVRVVKSPVTSGGGTLGALSSAG